MAARPPPDLLNLPYHNAPPAPTADRKAAGKSGKEVDWDEKENVQEKKEEEDGRKG